MTSNRDQSTMTTPAPRTVACLLLAALAVSFAPVTAGGATADWQVTWSVMSGGATSAVAPSLGVQGSMGQTATGSVQAADLAVWQGFWQEFGGPSPSCCVRRADVDHNGAGPDIADLLYLVNYMFQGGDQPPCPDEADIDGNGAVVVIDDLVYLVTYMFHGGSSPVPCS